MGARFARFIRPLRRRWYVYAPLLLLAAAASAWLGPIFIGDNFHAVIPGAVYRSAQPDPDNLVRWKEQYGLRTVINLRGSWVEDDWHREEEGACKRLGLRLVNVKLTAGKLPSPTDLNRLIDALKTPDSYPLLLHCRNGADRTGLASAVAMIVRDGVGPEEAADRCLRARYGHVAFSQAAAMRRFFDVYRDYLRTSGAGHSADAFIRWCREVYVPDGFRAGIEVLSAAQRVSAGQPIPIRVRVTNLSLDPWLFTGDPSTGTVLWVQKFIDMPLPRPAYCFSTRQPRRVAPGESIELEVKLRGYERAGVYHYRLDLYRPQTQDLFGRYGSRQVDGRVTVEAPLGPPIVRTLPAPGDE